MNVLNLFRRSTVAGHAAVTVLAALFVMGSSFAPTVLVLCESAHAGVQVASRHRIHCCGSGTDAQPGTHGEDAGYAACPPCSDKALTVDQHHDLRKAPVLAAPATYMLLPADAAFRAHLSKATAPPPHVLPPGRAYDPLCTVLRT